MTCAPSGYAPYPIRIGGKDALLPGPVLTTHDEERFQSMIDEDWRGFASAFNHVVRPDDIPGRSGRRMLVIGFAMVIVTALGSLLYGALAAGEAVAKPSEVKPIAPGPTISAAAGSAQSGRTWTGLAGPACDANATSSFAVYDYYTGTNSDETTGWSSAGGGYSGGSCAGSYLSIPVSGRRKAYDDTRFALWKFDFSATFTSASCKLSTYIPDSTDRAHVGGDPAYYYYYQTNYEYGSKDAPLGGYLVSQVTQRGRWVTGHSFKVRTGKVTVKMVDAGSRDGSAAKDAHVAAAQMRITCHSV